jgi:hypothetical protein
MIDKAPEQEYHRLDFEVYRAEASDRLRYQVEFGHSTLRNLMLINGGGIVALSTFIGNTSAVFDNAHIWSAFVAFSAALAIDLFGFFFAFLSQHQFFECSMYQMWNSQHQLAGGEQAYDRERILKSFNRGNVALVASIVSAILSLALFVIGSIFALQGVL